MSNIAKKRKAYNEDALAKVLEDVRSGTPINTASRLYDIPRTTIHSKIKKKFKSNKPGPATVLTGDEETQIVNWILFMSRNGNPVTKEHLLNSVAVFIKNTKMPSPFINGRPDRHWYEAFLRRHPELKLRMSENVSLSRALVSEENIRSWFKDIGNYLTKNNLADIDACRVFNSDETSLLLNPKGGRVLVKSGSKNVYKIVGNNEKENLTVLVTGNAAGQLAPTMVVYNYKRVPNNIYANLPSDFCAGISEKGWMTAMLFYEYVANTFWPWIIKMKYELPIVLFVDGHVSHLTQPLSEFCHTHGIVLAVLPPNATHFMQPMDVSMFFPLKTHWRKNVNLYKVENEVLSVPKTDFARLLKKVFSEMDLPTILGQGFRACGLYPFAVENVDFSKIFKRSTESQETTAAQTTSCNASVLQTFEQYIYPAKLETFRCCIKQDQWMGAIEDQNLFHVWQKMQQDCHEKEADIQNTTEADQNGTFMEYLLEPQCGTSNDHQIDQGETDFQIMDTMENVHPPDEVAETEDFHAEVSMANNHTNKEILSDIEAIFSIDDEGNVHFHEPSDSSLHLNKVLNTFNTNTKETDKICTPSISNERKICTDKSKVLEDIQHCSAIGNTGLPTHCKESNENAKIPFQFKDFIFWPKEDTSTKNKRPKKMKLPSVLTSEEGLRWYKEKEEKKQEIEKEKELKKLIRAAKAVIKKETQTTKQRRRATNSKTPAPENEHPYKTLPLEFLNVK